MTKAWCVSGRHYINTLNEKISDKLNPKTKKYTKFIKSRCDNCGRNKSKSFTK